MGRYKKGITRLLMLVIMMLRREPIMPYSCRRNGPWRRGGEGLTGPAVAGRRDGFGGYALLVAAPVG